MNLIVFSTIHVKIYSILIYLSLFELQSIINTTNISQNMQTILIKLLYLRLTDACSIEGELIMNTLVDCQYCNASHPSVLSGVSFIDLELNGFLLMDVILTFFFLCTMRESQITSS